PPAVAGTRRRPPPQGGRSRNTRGGCTARRGGRERARIEKAGTRGLPPRQRQDHGVPRGRAAVPDRTARSLDPPGELAPPPPAPLSPGRGGERTRSTPLLPGERGTGGEGKGENEPPRALTWEQCCAFAAGKVADALGPMFAEVDTFPTRVRLPDGPLQLVDRISLIEGEPKSMTGGRVVTEHTVRADRSDPGARRLPAAPSVQ